MTSGPDWQTCFPLFRGYLDDPVSIALTSKSTLSAYQGDLSEIRAADTAVEKILRRRDCPITHLAFLPSPEGGRLNWVQKTPNGCLLGIGDRVIWSKPVLDNKPLIASEDSSRFALAMIDGLHVFDRDGKKQGVVMPTPNAIQHFALSSSAGVLLIVTSRAPIGNALQPSTLHAYDLATLQPIWSGGTFHPRARIAISNCGNYLAVSRSTQVELYPFGRDRQLPLVPTSKLGRLHSSRGPRHYLMDLKCSVDQYGQPIIAALSSTGTIRIYGLCPQRGFRPRGKSFRELKEIRYDGLFPDSIKAGRIAFSPDGRFLGLGSDLKVEIFDLHANARRVKAMRYYRYGPFALSNETIYCVVVDQPRTYSSALE